MAKLNVNIEKQIAKAIHEALELADLNASYTASRSIAEKLYESQTELMEQLKPFWMVERLNWMIGRELRGIRLLHVYGSMSNLSYLDLRGCQERSPSQMPGEGVSIMPA